MNLLGKYDNGNFSVSIYDDGTKVRENDLDHFDASFPECMDVKITDYCEMGCPYCHENSSTDGKHGDILSPKFIDSLHPFTEIAIGGGNPLSHPDLIPFLWKLYGRNIIANITVNQKHYEENWELIDSLSRNHKYHLIRGIGISLTKPTPKLISLLKGRPDIVLHVINGIVDVKDLSKLYGRGLKLLILGYKEFRKGIVFNSPKVAARKQELSSNLMKVFMGFEIVSFDNLALKQLNVRNYMPDEKWNEFYMGDDGNFTMYVDLVEQKFAKCSVATERFDLLDNIDDMFAKIKTG